MKISGIYKIVNKVNGKYYIGSSKDINRRWIIHKNNLNKNRHHNQHLQNAWNKYGKENFDFIIIENSDIHNLLICEQKHLDLMDKKLSYNLSNIAGRVEFTNEIKKKMSINRKGIPVSDETKKKMSNFRKGKTKNKNGFYGKHHTELTILKMKINKKGELSHKYNHTIYSFINNKTNETFIGTSYQFKTKYNLSSSSVSQLINKKYNMLKTGWILIS